MTQYGRKLLNYIQSTQITSSTAQEIFNDSKSGFDDIDSVAKAIHELADDKIIELNNYIGLGFNVI